MNTIRYETDNAEIIAVECGIGKVNAAFAATVLILDHQVDCVLNVGLSGAIQHLRKGDVVAGTSYIECDFDLSAFGYPLGEKPGNVRYHTASDKLLDAAKSIDGVLTARLGTGDFFLADPVKKQEYKEAFDIEAFDMETAAIASVCDRLETPFLSIRKISDDADDSATGSYRELNDLAEKALSEVLLALVKALG
jgi:adenosylhomocysteine nucleosidase